MNYKPTEEADVEAPDDAAGFLREPPIVRYASIVRASIYIRTRCGDE